MGSKKIGDVEQMGSRDTRRLQNVPYGPHRRHDTCETHHHVDVPTCRHHIRHLYVLSTSKHVLQSPGHLLAHVVHCNSNCKNVLPVRWRPWSIVICSRLVASDIQNRRPYQINSVQYCRAPGAYFSRTCLRRNNTHCDMDGVVILFYSSRTGVSRDETQLDEKVGFSLESSVVPADPLSQSSKITAQSLQFF